MPTMYKVGSSKFFKSVKEGRRAGYPHACFNDLAKHMSKSKPKKKTETETGSIDGGGGVELTNAEIKQYAIDNSIDTEGVHHATLRKTVEAHISAEV